LTPSCLSRSRKARFPDITGKFLSIRCGSRKARDFRQRPSPDRRLVRRNLFFEFHRAQIRDQLQGLVGTRRPALPVAQSQHTQRFFVPAAALTGLYRALWMLRFGNA
jgi:hypothetical protein